MANQVRVAIIAIIVVIPLLSLVLWSSDSSQLVEPDRGQSKTIVMASFYPLYEFAKEIGGQHIDVSLLVPQGVEPHDWEPSIRDVQRVQGADVVIINGIGFEDWIDEIDMINSDVLIIDSSQGISIIQNHEGEHHDEHEDGIESHNAFGDPHIWLNPAMVKSQIQNIANGLKEKDPANSDYYQANASQFISKVGALDAKIRSELHSCKKDFIAFHNAFSYFANEYGLTQHSIIDTTGPHGEPTPKKLQNVITLAKSLELDVIFTEEGVDARTSQVIADELGGTTLLLSTLEVVDDDSSYIEKMEENLENLKAALCR